MEGGGDVTGDAGVERELTDDERDVRCERGGWAAAHASRSMRSTAASEGREAWRSAAAEAEPSSEEPLRESAGAAQRMVSRTAATLPKASHLRVNTSQPRSRIAPAISRTAASNSAASSRARPSAEVQRARAVAGVVSR